MHIVSGQIRYGPNAFSVKQPTFMELYKAQLLSPFTVFQVSTYRVKIQMSGITFLNILFPLSLDFLRNSVDAG